MSEKGEGGPPVQEKRADQRPGGSSSRDAIAARGVHQPVRDERPPSGAPSTEDQQQVDRSGQKWLIIGLSAVATVLVLAVGGVLLLGDGAPEAGVAVSETSEAVLDDASASQPSQEALRAALLEQNIRAVERIIRAHPELVAEKMFTAERTPLHWAAENGGPEVVQLLLDCEANLGSQNRDGQTPLHLVAKRRGPRKDNAAHIAGLLIKAGADVNSRDAQGNTPLHAAAGWNAPAVARLLLENGAQTNARNDFGRTALGSADNPEVAAVIKQHGGAEDPESHLLDAVKSGDLQRVRALLDNDPKLAVDARTDDGMEFTPLHLAVAMKNPEMVAVLLAHGADPNVENGQGHTARDLAGRSGGFGEPSEYNKIRELFKKHRRDRSDN